MYRGGKLPIKVNLKHQLLLNLNKQINNNHYLCKCFKLIIRIAQQIKKGADKTKEIKECMLEIVLISLVAKICLIIKNMQEINNKNK